MSTLHLRTIFVSDVHLGTRDVQAEQLLDFLRHTESEYLYLVGDIIDFWKARTGWYWPRLHTEIVQAILAKARRGTRVIYIPGNHDEWLRDHAGSEFNGVEIRTGLVHQTLRGKRLLVLHGDEFDSAVRCNRLLSHVGSGFYDLLLYLNRFHNAIRRRCGFPYWSLSAYIKRRLTNAVAYIEQFAAAARHEAARHKVDGLVCGHIHQPALVTVDGIQYVNTGDWVEHCSGVVETLDGELHLLHWARESAQWLDRHATDAVAAPALAEQPGG